MHIEGAARVVFTFCVGAAAIACSANGATGDPALGARMRVQGAQYVPGPMPSSSPNGPAVEVLDLATDVVWPGEIDKAISGSLDPSATAVAIALSDDTGYWIVAAGVPDVSAPTLPTFRAKATFASALSPGAYSLEIRAVDASGAFGVPRTQTLAALAAAPSAPPPRGELVVTLTWDTESDLDLHVVDPSATEIFHGNAETFGPDGGVAGRLDFDSNGKCVIDGRREEDVIWATAPPSGHYLVRVDTPSLCGQPIAHWTLRATAGGTVVGDASGVSLDEDTWGAHDRGAGLLALDFDVP